MTRWLREGGARVDHEAAPMRWQPVGLAMVLAMTDEVASVLRSTRADPLRELGREVCVSSFMSDRPVPSSPVSAAARLASPSPFRVFPRFLIAGTG